MAGGNTLQRARGYQRTARDEYGGVLSEVGDPQNLLGKLLPSPNDDRFHCLALVSAIEALARDAAAEPHRYLKFIGD